MTSAFGHGFDTRHLHHETHDHLYVAYIATYRWSCFFIATGSVTIKPTQIYSAEADVRSLLSNFSGYVISRNVPKCKKFIRDFVKEVIVYKEHIEVIFNVSFSLLKNNEGVKVISQIIRFDLYERYSQSFYIKVS